MKSKKNGAFLQSLSEVVLRYLEVEATSSIDIQRSTDETLNPKKNAAQTQNKLEILALKGLGWRSSSRAGASKYTTPANKKPSRGDKGRNFPRLGAMIGLKPRALTRA